MTLLDQPNRYICTTSTSPSPKCAACQEPGRRRYKQTRRCGPKLLTSFLHLGKTPNGAWGLIPCADQGEAAPALTAQF